MLVAAKRISNFFQTRHLFILFFWSMSIFTFFLTSTTLTVISANNLESNFNNKTNHFLNLYLDKYLYRDLFRILTLILVPIICLTIFSRSIPIIISISMSKLQTIFILSFLSRLNSVFNIDSSFLIIILHVTTANSIFLRRCWDKYRRGPCSSTIVRLLLATIDKSLPLLLTTSICSSIIPLSSIMISPNVSINPAISIFVLCILQNISTLSLILSILLIRNTFNWCIPNIEIHFTKRIQAFFEEKLVYFAHFMCRIGHRLLSSPIKFPIFLIYIVLIASYLSFILIRLVNFVNFTIENGKFECNYYRCYYPIISTLSLFLIPPVFYCFINRLQFNTIISLFGLIFTLIIIQLFNEFYPNMLLTPLQRIILSIIPADGGIRFCYAYRMSRKKSYQQKVFDMMDTLFSQVTLSSLVSIFSLFFLYQSLDNSFFVLSFILMIFCNWFTVIVFYPCSVLVIAPIIFGKFRRESQTSETKSMNTDRFSSHFLIENSDYTKKYSTSNYYGPAKHKRSYNVVITDSRRASMPVSVQKISITNKNDPIFKKRSWATAECYSVDGVITMTPREALHLMRKEDSITSDNILIKELALI